MPIHFEDRDVASEIAGLRSALIVPCNLCPAVTVAIREDRPFMRFFRSLVRSEPFEDYIEALRALLGENGVSTKVFRSNLYHQWFLCMWTSRRREKLRRQAKGYDAVIVLGCDSATETVRGVVSSDVRVLEGMKVTGIMNGRLSFRLPGELFFDQCRVVPISGRRVA
jgi:hypothetical protein